jgi:hypothetical protein
MRFFAGRKGKGRGHPVSADDPRPHIRLDPSCEGPDVCYCWVSVAGAGAVVVEPVVVSSVI